MTLLEIRSPSIHHDYVIGSFMASNWLTMFAAALSMYFWAISSRARKEKNTTDPRTTAESSSNPSKRSLVKCLSFSRVICIKVLITNIGVFCNWRSEAFMIHPQKIVMFSTMGGLSSMMVRCETKDLG